MARELTPDTENAPSADERSSGSAPFFDPAFDALGLGLAWVTADGRCLAANARLCEILGYDPEEITRVRVRDVVESGDLTAELPSLLGLRQGALDAYRMEKRLRRKDGTRTWVESTLSAARGDGQRPERLLVVVRELEGDAEDGSGRTSEAALELETERRRLDAVLDLLPVAVWIADRDGRIVAMNRSVREIWGGDAPASEASDSYHADYCGFRPDGTPLEAGEWGLARAVERGEPSGPEEVVIHCFDGCRKTILNYGVPVLDSAGEVQGGVALSLDITERKRAEEALRDTHLRLELLYRATAGLLASDRPRAFVEEVFGQLSEILDLDLYLNYLIEERGETRTLRLDSHAGIPPDEVPGLERLELGSAVGGAVARDARARVVEHVQDLADDDVAWVRSLGVQAYACHPLLANGTTLGTLSFGSRSRPTFTSAELDLMEAVAAQVAVAIQRSREREAERTARREAERAAASKSAFMATVSHELRTPLNAIVGYTQLIEDGVVGPLEEGARRYVDRIAHGARQLQQLIGEILTFSRLEAGQEAATLEEVRLDDVLEAVVAMVEPLAAERGLAFRVRRSGAPASLRTDPLKLRQILLNLLGNAVKFTEEGEVRLGVVGQPGEVLFRVEDTGPGIPADERETIFEPFWRSDDVKGGAEGSGLGLAISARYAELLGGSIEVGGQAGEGSVFELRLPTGEG